MCNCIHKIGMSCTFLGDASGKTSNMICTFHDISNRDKINCNEYFDEDEDEDDLFFDEDFLEDDYDPFWDDPWLDWEDEY